MIKRERCIQCKTRKIEGIRGMYCSFRCSYDYGMRLATFQLGPDKDCYIDDRVRVQAGTLSLTKRVAAWYVKTGLIVRGTDLLNTCPTKGCTNPDHFKDKRNEKRPIFYQDNHFITVGRRTANITMFINGEQVTPRIEYPVVGLRPGLQKIRLSYISNGDLFSVILDVPDETGNKRSS